MSAPKEKFIILNEKKEFADQWRRFRERMEELRRKGQTVLKLEKTSGD